MFALIALLYSLLYQCLVARLRPDYAWQSNSLSELGEKGSRYERWVAWGYFMPTALVLAIGVAGAYQREILNTAQAFYLSFLPLAYAVSALFPCDPGAPISGSLRNSVHMLFGAAEYLLVPIGVYLSTWAGLNLSGPLAVFILAVFIWAALLLMLLPILAPWKGVIQRLAECTLFVAVAYVTW